MTDREKSRLTPDDFEINRKGELVIEEELIEEVAKKKAYEPPSKLRNICIGGGGATVV